MTASNFARSPGIRTGRRRESSLRFDRFKLLKIRSCHQFRVDELGSTAGGAWATLRGEFEVADAAPAGAGLDRSRSRSRRCRRGRAAIPLGDQWARRHGLEARRRHRRRGRALRHRHARRDRRPDGRRRRRSPALGTRAPADERGAGLLRQRLGRQRRLRRAALRDAHHESPAELLRPQRQRPDRHLPGRQRHARHPARRSDRVLRRAGRMPRLHGDRRRRRRLSHDAGGRRGDDAGGPRKRLGRIPVGAGVLPARRRHRRADPARSADGTERLSSVPDRDRWRRSAVGRPRVLHEAAALANRDGDGRPHRHAPGSRLCVQRHVRRRRGPGGEGLGRGLPVRRRDPVESHGFDLVRSANHGSVRHRRRRRNRGWSRRESLVVAARWRNRRVRADRSDERSSDRRLGRGRGRAVRRGDRLERRRLDRQRRQRRRRATPPRPGNARPGAASRHRQHGRSLPGRRFGRGVRRLLGPRAAHDHASRPARADLPGRLLLGRHDRLVHGRAQRHRRRRGSPSSSGGWRCFGARWRCCRPRRSWAEGGTGGASPGRG